MSVRVSVCKSVCAHDFPENPTKLCSAKNQEMIDMLKHQLWPQINLKRLASISQMKAKKNLSHMQRYS